MVCCFKQKTAYELRISDWSSDVCSSDLAAWRHAQTVDPGRVGIIAVEQTAQPPDHGARIAVHGGVEIFAAPQCLGGDRISLGRAAAAQAMQIERASCRENVCPYV